MTSDGYAGRTGTIGRPLVLYLVLPACLAVGLIRWPISAIAAVAATLVVAFSLLPASRSVKIVTVPLVCLLAGYAFFGKSFAYLGFPPVYIGEVVLALALIGCILTGSLWRPLRSKVAWLLLAFAAWCALRTVPYLSVYGADALRDAALWGYGSFAFVVAGLLLRHGSLQAVTAGYRRLLPLHLVWTVLAGVVWMFVSNRTPAFGQADGPMLMVKGGDAAVHLAGIAGFLILGLYRTAPQHIVRNELKEWCLWLVWAAAFVLFGSQTRGGLLSMLISLAVVLAIRPKGKWGKLAVVGLCSAALLLFLDLELDFGNARKVSPQQIVASLASITGEGDTVYAGTRRWRLNWWQTILDYSVYGQFFWSGKGFGVNLADDDGFQVAAEHRLRSPHNGHLTVLARTGVPGLALWVVLQGGWCLGLLRSYRMARRAGESERAAVIAWILAYWTAFIVNGAFDVYLEGPQGGIWFWAVFGVGLAVLAERPLRRLPWQQQANPPQISRGKWARPSWQNSIAKNGLQPVKPRAWRSIS